MANSSSIQGCRYGGRRFAPRTMWRQLGIWRTSNCVIERGVATPAIDPCMRAWDFIERMVNTHDWGRSFHTATETKRGESVAR
jgi:hypothetical protein